MGFSCKDQMCKVNKLFIIWLFALFLKDCNPPIDIIYGLLAKFFFCLFMDQDGIKVHKLTQIKNKANIQPPWLNKLGQQRIYYMGFKEIFLVGHGR